jgi:integrase
MERLDSNTDRRRTRLTRKALDRVLQSHVQGRRVRVWDTELPAFYLQITPAGTPSYCIRFVRADGTKGDFTLGSARIGTPEAARAAAREKLARYQLEGIDPVQYRRDERERARRERLATFAALADEYLQTSNLEKTSRAGDESALRVHILPRFGKRPTAKISKEDIETAIREIREVVVKTHSHYKNNPNGFRTANRCHEIISRIYNFGIERKLCAENPARFERIFDDSPDKRVRALDDARLAGFWRFLVDGPPTGPTELLSIGVMLHFLTLQRPAEIVRAHVADFDWSSSTWRPHPSRTKTKQRYFVPLTDLTAGLFRRAFEVSGGVWAFPSRRNAAEHLDFGSLRARFDSVRDAAFAAGTLDTKDIVLYDGRRFGRTQLVHRLKFSKEVAELVINHLPKRDPSTVYDVEDHSEHVRAAQEAWTNEVCRIVGLEDRTSHLAGDAWTW